MTATPAELSRLRVAVLEQLYPLALGMKLSPAQINDLASRCVASGKVFLTASDSLVGWDIPELVSVLKEDPANAHVFKTADDPKKTTATTGNDFQAKYGISKAAFDALPARRRLEFANKGSCV